MTKIKRLVAVVLALLMIFGSVSIVASAWDATTDDGFTLNVNTKIFREVDGEWIETTKVKAGETVKARVYLGTDYFTNGGDLLFFYNTSFFEDAYSSDLQTLAVNTAVYAGGNYGITGTFYNSLSATNVEGRLVRLGVIDQNFADKHNYFAVSFSLAGDKKNNLLLANEWFCEFDLKVKADASAADAGDMFALANTFRSDAVKTNYCNVSKGPSFGYNEDVVDMTQWNATVSVASQPVTLYTNYVEATFDANGGVFTDGEAEKVLTGEAGTALNVGAPVYEGFTFKGWVAEGTTEVLQDVVALPQANATYVAQWESAVDKYDETLGFRTEIYRQNDNGEWVFTEKVIPGETVKARIFIDTTYFTNAGDFVVFYDKDFFEEVDPNFTEGSYTDLVTNDSATSSAAIVAAEGTYSLVPSSARVIKRLVEAGHITQDFAETHTAYLATYKFVPANSAVLSGDEYFAEWELKVKDSATGEGDFFVVEETIQNASAAGQKAYINIPLSYEGGTDDDSISLFEVNVNTEVESNPVTTVSAINFDANGGEFATGETTFVIEGDIADPVDAATIPEVTKDGYTFIGWVPADLADPTEADVVDVPTEIPFDELFLKALWINEVTITIDPSNGDPIIEETVTAGDPFDKPEDPSKEGHYLAGWVDGDGNFMTELPDNYPAEDTTYTAVFETYTYTVEYYVLNSETLKFDRVAAVNTAYGEEILAVPPTYTLPEGFTLSAAYTDISFTNAFAAGTTMPADNVQLYYQAVANKYPATFDLDGGNIDGNTDDVVIETVYGQQIKTPADPVKEGHTFTGWTPMVGMMDSEGADFIATWEVNDYTATYIVEGKVYEAYDIPFGGEMETPAAPVLEGYNFAGWDPSPIPATMPAEDLTFTAVFEKKDITITLKLDGGEYDGDPADIVIAGKYGDAVTAPDAALLAKEGYVFGGWEPALPDALPAEDAEYTAIWNPATDTPYQVWVYLENTDGTFPADDAPSQVINMTGVTDSVINVAIPTPYGFVLNETKGDVANDVTIAADGSTVYKIYFDREKYDIKFDGNGGTIAGEPSTTDEYRYLASVTAPAEADLYKEGYTFLGWTPAVDSEATKDVTYVAQWEVNSYDVNYMIKGTDGAEDELFKTESFNYGDALTVTADKPEKTGYNFGGWTDENGATYRFPATMPAEDITVYAKFTPRNYEAKFYEEADADAPYDITNADFDAPVEAPASQPSKEGYEFGGWSTDGVTPVDFTKEIMDEEGKNYVAIWNAAEQDIPVEYYYMDTDGTYPAAADKTETVKFKTGETATVAPADEANYTVDADKSVLEAVVAADGSTVLKVYYKLNSTKLTIEVDGEETVIEGLVGSDVPADKIPDTDKDGYTFNGWVDENGDPVDVPATMPEEDTTIKADYSINSYNVTYYVDGEVYDGPNATVYGTAIAEPSIPTKVGYAFAGWLDDANHKPSDYGVMPSTDLEFYAQWTANANIGYVLEVYEMGTDGTYPTTPTTVYNFNDGVVGDERTVTPTVPTGFTLDVETENTAEKSVLTGEIPATGTLVLKAYYTRDQYTLYIDVDGDVTEEVYYYQQEIADIADPVKKGWTFTGWEPEVPTTMPANDVTVVAQFTKNSYPASFNAGEGAFATGDKTVETDVPYAEPITAPANNPVRDGYNFKGWSTDGTNVIENLGRMDDDGAEFIAVWEKAEVTVTFYNYLPSEKGPAVPEGQATYVYDQATYLYGETVVFPADPTIQGHEDHYVFIGWVDADGNAVEPGITAPSANLDIYASYERVKVMLIPKNDTCTTVIDRAGLTVDDYTADSEWYVYGLEEILSLNLLLNEYIDVQGDGKIVVTKIKDNSKYYGTGSIIDVYDNVTGELVESFRIIIFGDIDGDSYANGVDLSILSEEVLSLTYWSIDGADEYCAYKVKAADLRPDGVIDVQDKALHNKHVLSLGYINQETGLVEM